MRIKTGPHLKADKNSTLQVLKSLEIDVVTLANNHVLDYDEQGVGDTLEFCKENDIKTVGAGMNLKEASQTLYLDTKEGKIAIMNFAENEWASATDDSAGAHPMDIIDNAKAINDARDKADFVFVIVHGGHEYYNLPSPRMQKQYRFYVDNGADAIVGHHTHCIGGYEIYNNVPIIYSLGNFIFTLPSKKDVWYEGLLCKLNIEKDMPIKFEIHPVKQQKKSFQTALLKNSEKDFVFEKIQELNNSIAQEGQLLKKWKEFVREKAKQYLNSFSPIQLFGSRYLTYFVKKIKTDSWFMNKKHYALINNLVRCEAHKDLTIESVKYLLKK